MMTYEEAVKEIEEIPKHTSKNPLEETRGFYDFIKEEYNFREESLGKIIHVAGTNGKGSVCSFLNSICMEAGYRTGLFTSPHLITTRERFAVNNEIISEERFVDGYLQYRNVITRYNEQKPDYHATYFEILFFIMIFIFKEAKLDYLVLETGLGGRLDTTNVIERPALNIITEIGFDHMTYLGNTIEKIAGEKAGIIKKGAKLIFTDKREEATRVIEAKAKELEVPFCKIGAGDYKINEITKKSIDFSVCNRYYDYNGLKINISALYQVENASISIAAAEALADSKITRDVIISGISKMKWPGRMEEIAKNVYVDGAHNEDGIEAFSSTLEKIWGDNRITIVFSAVNDKNYVSMIKRICELKGVENLIFTHIPGSRGTSLEELTASIKGYTDKNIFALEEISEAINSGLELKEGQGEKGVLFFVGSLYLVGIIKDYFCEKGLEK